MSEAKKPEAELRLWVSSSPHIHSGESIAGIMWRVNLALLPATLLGIYLFGLHALRVILVTLASSVVTEAILLKVFKRDTSIWDGSAWVTGLLLALNLPPRSPNWLCIVGGVFAILVAKQIFGGLGYNPFNPALASRVFLLIAFPEQMTAYWYQPVNNFFGIVSKTGASPLGLLDQGRLGELFAGFKLTDLFLGTINGCIGEVSVLALLIGAGYLLWKRIISWEIPISYIVTVGVITGIFWLINPDRYVSPLFHIFSGGLMLGAWFMATDMVTSPITRLGQIIFGMGCGIITAVIRLVPGGFPEGVSFSILMMNAATPLLDRYTLPRVFGTQKKELAG